MESLCTNETVNFVKCRTGKIGQLREAINFGVLLYFKQRQIGV